MGDFWQSGCEEWLFYINNLFITFKSILVTVITTLKDGTNVKPETAIQTIGISLTSLFFCMEMFSQLAQFRVERIEEAIRIGMRFVVAKVIIENTQGITSGIFGIFNVAGGFSVVHSIDEIRDTLSATIDTTAEAGFMNMGFFLLCCFLAITYCVFLAIFIKILLSYVGICFEIGVHQAVAPIALSTLCNDTARSTGISFIKSYSAACLQLVVIFAIFKVFNLLFPVLSTIKLNGTGTNSIFDVLFPHFVSLILLFAISKAISVASDLTKRMFGA